MTEPTPVDRMRDVLLAEREVIEAAEKWAGKINAPIPWDFELLRRLDFQLFDAVSKLREVRGK